MEEFSSFPMEKTGRIIRRSIFTFLQNYQFFTSTVALLAFPFAGSTLVSQASLPSSPFFALVHGRLRTLFLAAGFPPSSDLFNILNLKLSQTIVTFLLVLPFSLTFLLFAKALIIKALLYQENRHFSSWNKLFKSLYLTQICNSLVILSANATCFSLLLMAFNSFDILGLSSPRHFLLLSALGIIIYSVILANAYVLCNLAIVLSGMEKRGGFITILEAFFLIRGRTGTALSLALPFNIAMASIESLFQYRVVRAYNGAVFPNSSMVFEGIFIAYLYAILVVLDTIVGCTFLKSCRTEFKIDQENLFSEIEEDHPIPFILHSNAVNKVGKRDYIVLIQES
ncbi:uncharacterized protein LOC111400433 [Olea europaea subsp. europaea]|uniref:Uncharacterized protein LOC111400433 n=1 Tax=Olea europaea subsp. europaea TaxID=158383 RepID=A0A8S0Q7I6_OLEEU|nr:uncharacterized protein LOC111400433 [Olea europaea subsp. europaea]